MLSVATNSGSQDRPRLFAGVSFLLSGFDSLVQSQLSQALEQHGAVNIHEYNKSCTHVIVSRNLLWDDPVCAAARNDGKFLCSEIWVSDCLDLGAVADANNVVYRPLRVSQGIPGTGNLVICLTGYQSLARRNVMRMVHMMGAQFSKPLVAHKITHLICYKFEGEKFTLAKQIGVKLVNHQWLEDCLKSWTLLSEEEYAKSGLEVEVAEVEAKDSEDDGKSNLFEDKVLAEQTTPFSGGGRVELKIPKDTCRLNGESFAQDKVNNDANLSSDFVSVQECEHSSRKPLSSDSIRDVENSVMRNESAREILVEGTDADLTSPLLNDSNSLGLLRTSKRQAVRLSVDDNTFLVEHSGKQRVEADACSSAPLEGCDLEPKCKPGKTSNLTTPDANHKNHLDYEFSFVSPKSMTPAPQESPGFAVSCETDRMKLDGKEGATIMTSVPSAQKSRSKKKGKQPRTPNLRSPEESHKKKAEEVSGEKRLRDTVSGQPELAGSHRKQITDVNSNNNGRLAGQGGDMIAAGEATSNLESGRHISASFCRISEAFKVATPSKDARSLLVSGESTINNNEKVMANPSAEAITTDKVEHKKKNLPKEGARVKSGSKSNAKRDQSVKAKIVGVGTKKQSERKRPLVKNTTETKQKIVETMVLDKENMIQSHDCKNEGKVRQDLLGTGKPSELAVVQDKIPPSANIKGQRCFALSGHKDDIKPLQVIVKRLGGKLCRESHQWSHQTTHLVIAGQLRRTEKFFAAAAAGRWILQADYLRESSEAGVFLDERKYEWQGVGMTVDGAISFEAPSKWREQRETTGCGALEGLRVLLYGECIIPSLDTLRRAIRAGGADLVATCPPYTKFFSSKLDFAIVSPGTSKTDQWIQEFLSHDIACVTTDFFVDYVCKPSSSLERHTLYNTHSLVQHVLDRLKASVSGVKTASHATFDKGRGDGKSEDICCAACGQGDREDVMLLCGDDKGNGCGRAVHIDCCQPPLEEVPANDWFCDQCTKPTATSKRKNKRKAL